MTRNWKICLLVVVTSLLFLLTACGHEHTWAEETTKDYVEAVTVKTRTCEECGEVEEETIPMETLHDDSLFLCNAYEFALRLEKILLEGEDTFGHITVDPYMSSWWITKENGENDSFLFVMENSEHTNSNFGEIAAILYGDDVQREFFSLSILRALMPTLEDPEDLYDRLVAADGEPIEEDNLVCHLLTLPEFIILDVMTEVEAQKYDE